MEPIIELHGTGASAGAVHRQLQWPRGGGFYNIIWDMRALSVRVLCSRVLTAL